MKLAAEQLFSEEITDIERGAFLSALRVKGETPEEIAGLAAAIQAKSLQLPVHSPGYYRQLWYRRRWVDEFQY